MNAFISHTFVTYDVDIQTYRSPTQLTQEDSMIIRECDLYNHNHDGGLWIVINGKVYDVQDFKSQALCDGDLLQRYAGKDATQVNYPIFYT